MRLLAGETESLVRPTRLVNDPIALLDTSMYSENCGDYVIMHYANLQLSKILPKSASIMHIPTHGWDESVEYARRDVRKIACGTNLLPWDYEKDHALATPRTHLGNYAHSVCLLAVGMREVQGQMRDFTPYTARFLRFLFDPNCLHSVRDEHTKQRLHTIGVDNVLNTACVTMWNLTEEFCDSISRNRHDEVITTITEYAQDPKQDKYMLETLLRHYDRVHLWIQSVDDKPYLESLHIDDTRLHLIDHSFEAFDSFVKEHHESVDYFGTRLHAGIHCLNHGIRAMIVSVDNRAADIARDTNLPVMPRNGLQELMEAWIDHSDPVRITLPTDAIRQWKEQFLSLA
ncbi:polysaccharide pyruvyl transferase family protein [Bifidobacterium callimiconis]|uniref:Capsular exopolysaccharide biosynthesis protein (Wzm) n=1 Tax=Bifidobacterium callimiconis TaxID=2306973 RepID=A0A430FE73_9BIFI|nr:polysaccharide pyruvyl transferase family protein [Bifidobacterium callimiconis]RSX51143.1 capsular exopolysaccharide biosynthesis protein (Wzm) [Bifidobacterium callimiconis]